VKFEEVTPEVVAFPILGGRLLKPKTPKLISIVVESFQSLEGGY